MPDNQTLLEAIAERNGGIVLGSPVARPREGITKHIPHAIGERIANRMKQEPPEKIASA